MLNALPLNSLGFPKLPKDTRVAVAMSGGVDSSVVAAMLKAEGYEVIGLTMQLYDHGAALHKKGACCAGQDISDARTVAERFDIPHYVLDYESRFRESVMEKFADSYLNGETPVPCIECNRTVKFIDMLKMAQDIDADVLATGHYVRNERLESGHYGLFRPADTARDQSYFLYGTTQEQLDYVRFPLGAMTKPEVRALANHYELVVADKPDSQDICFVPEGNYAKVIEKLRPDSALPGEIIHEDGRKLGGHAGILNYTIGQRKGLGIAVGEPLHVLKLDAKNRTVLVGPKKSLMRHDFTLKQVNWLGDAPLSNAPFKMYVKVRSVRPPKEALLTFENGVLNVNLPEGEEGIAPGQACVFYETALENARVFGGGIING
jgi:tRNA-uridine 2-sulfurtransferase